VDKIKGTFIERGSLCSKCSYCSSSRLLLWRCRLSKKWFKWS